MLEILLNNYLRSQIGNIQGKQGMPKAMSENPLLMMLLSSMIGNQSSNMNPNRSNNINKQPLINMLLETINNSNSNNNNEGNMEINKLMNMLLGEDIQNMEGSLEENIGGTETGINDDELLNEILAEAGNEDKKNDNKHHKHKKRRRHR